MKSPSRSRPFLLPDCRGSTGANLCDYDGPFFSDELDSTWRLSVGDGQLSFRVLNQPPVPLALVKLEEFASTSGGVKLRFEREAGVAWRFSVQSGRVKDLVFTRVSNGLPVQIRAGSLRGRDLPPGTDRTSESPPWLGVRGCSLRARGRLRARLVSSRAVSRAVRRRRSPPRPEAR